MSDYTQLQTQRMTKAEAEALVSQLRQQEEVRGAYLDRLADPSAQWTSQKTAAPKAAMVLPAAKQVKLSCFEKKEVDKKAEHQHKAWVETDKQYAAYRLRQETQSTQGVLGDMNEISSHDMLVEKVSEAKDNLLSEGVLNPGMFTPEYISGNFLAVREKLDRLKDYFTLFANGRSDIIDLTPEESARISLMEEIYRKAEMAYDAAMASELRRDGSGYSGVREMGVDLEVRRSEVEKNERARREIAELGRDFEYKVAIKTIDTVAEGIDLPEDESYRNLMRNLKSENAESVRANADTMRIIDTVYQKLCDAHALYKRRTAAIDRLCAGTQDEELRSRYYSIRNDIVMNKLSQLEGRMAQMLEGAEYVLTGKRMSDDAAAYMAENGIVTEQSRAAAERASAYARIQSESRADIPQEEEKRVASECMRRLAAYDIASLESLDDEALMARSEELIRLSLEYQAMTKFWDHPDPDGGTKSIREAFEEANGIVLMPRGIEIVYFATKARCLSMISAYRQGMLGSDMLTAEERNALLPHDQELGREELTERILGHVKKMMATNEFQHNVGRIVHGIPGERTYIHRNTQRKKNGTIRKAVSELIPGAYARLDAIERGEASPVVRLHAAQGRKYLERGENVIHIDMAGSGFTEFVAKHKKFGGKSNFYISHSRQAKIRDIESAQQSGQIPNEIVREAVASDFVNRFRERYGASVSTGQLAGLQHIRQKRESLNVGGEQVTSSRTTMAGPQGRLIVWKPGLRNSGEYSIEHLREYMLTTAKEQLIPIFEEWIRQGTSANKKDIHLLIKGHSRGAVAASEGSMMINKWLLSDPRYSEFARYVKLELVQYDPVPGLGSASGVNEIIDHESRTEYEGTMAPLGHEAETTVVYSLYTQHPVGFMPQTVHGAKRIILSPFNHDVGLGEADETQRKTTGPNRLGFTDARTGEVYRSSGLSELEEGVYIADENNVLIRIEDYETAEKIMGKYFSFLKGGTQVARHSVLVDVLKEWFRRRDIREAAVPGAA